MTADEYRRRYAKPAPTAAKIRADEYQAQHGGKVRPQGLKSRENKQYESQQQSECVKLEIKPLSVNKAWKGQRFKTDAYRRYEQAVLLLLPQISLPAPPYKLSLVFGFSNLASDLDNPAKCFIDCMQQAYGFNDKHIVELNIKKELVAKGCEFIIFNIQTAE